MNDSIETGNPLSTERSSSVKGGVREGAGPKPLPPEQKMIGKKVNLVPGDWEYLELFIDEDVDPKQRTPGHLIRAALEELRTMKPAGPHAFGHQRDPNKPRTQPLTPKAALYAAREGITRSEALNLAWAAFEAAEKGK